MSYSILTLNVFGPLSFPNILFALIGFVLALSLSSPAEAGELAEVSAQVSQLDIRTQLDSLLHKIEEAGQRGVGTKAYQDAYSGIEAEYKAGAKADALQKRLASLAHALDEQSARAKDLKEQKLPLSSYAKVLRGDDGVNYGPFMADLQRRIYKGWHPPKLSESYKLMTFFKINRAGEFLGIRVITPHALESVNEAAIKAVKDAAPFRFPAVSREKAVDIEFSFDYNVYNGGTKSLGAN
ncbi:MAG: TonB C-terminal domain-containing protein [Candidatus Obscuribacterales bacterium]